MQWAGHVAYAGVEECIYDFDEKDKRKEITKKTQKYVEDS
jgi:hypothetical protein